MDGSVLNHRRKPVVSLLVLWAITCLAIFLLAGGAHAAKSLSPSGFDDEPDSAASAVSGASAAVDVPADETVGYDTIVNELSRQADRPSPNLKIKAAKAKSIDPFDNVWIHFGVGLANVMETISFDDGHKFFLGQKGVQIATGIDLFSPSWAAEGTYRGFGEAEDSQAHISLSEFELKLFYKNRYLPNLNLRVGGGLSGRYMTIRRVGAAEIQYATPSSVATFGADLFLSDNLSFGADLSARNSMISDTLDRASFDATLRVDTHF